MSVEKITYEGFVQLEREGKWLELLDGRVMNHPAPGLEHQRTGGTLFRLLAAHVEKHGLGLVLAGPFDLLLGPHDYLEPDILYVPKKDYSRLTPRGLVGPPALAVEVISEHTEAYDRSTKKARYAHFGLPWLWLVDPFQKSIEIYRLRAGRLVPGKVYRPPARFSSPLFPGLRIDTRAPFRPL